MIGSGSTLHALPDVAVKELDQGCASATGLRGFGEQQTLLLEPGNEAEPGWAERIQSGLNQHAALEVEEDAELEELPPFERTLYRRQQT